MAKKREKTSKIVKKRPKMTICLIFAEIARY